MDYGADFYAPQSWNDEPNGRRIVLGWMSNWQYARQTPTETWRGMFNVPRELSLIDTKEGPRLVQAPIKEIQTLRGEHHHWQKETMMPGENLLENISGDCLEIIASVTVNLQATSFGFKLRVGAKEQTLVRYDIQKQELVVDRSKSGIGDFHEAFASIQTVKLRPIENVIQLHILLDRCSIEVFANGGEAVVSDVIFPSTSSMGLDLFTEGGELKIIQLDVYQLTPAVSQGNH
jgi:fructan beta-fructosidase